MVFIMLISAIGMTAIILLFFGLERPYVLSLSISLILIFFHFLLKKGCFVASFYSNDISEKREEIESKEPNSYSEWLGTKKTEGSDLHS